MAATRNYACQSDPTLNHQFSRDWGGGIQIDPPRPTARRVTTGISADERLGLAIMLEWRRRHPEAGNA